MMCETARRFLPTSEVALPNDVRLPFDSRSDPSVVPPWTAVAHFGAFGLPYWHVAVYAGDDVTIEFSAKRGLFVSTLARGKDSFFARAARDAPSCPLARPAEVQFFRMVPLGEEGSALPPLASTPELRVSYLAGRLGRLHYDMLHLNCEHVARAILVGQAASSQARAVLLSPNRPLAHAACALLSPAKLCLAQVTLGSVVVAAGAYAASRIASRRATSPALESANA